MAKTIEDMVAEQTKRAAPAPKNVQAEHQDESAMAHRGQTDIKRRLREAGVLLLFPLAIYFLVCVFSYNPLDSSWSHSGSDAITHNLGGTVGAWIADLTRYLFGVVAYVFPLLLMLVAIRVLRRKRVMMTQVAWDPSMRLLGFVVFFAFAPALAWMSSPQAHVLPEGAGGIIGRGLGSLLLDAFGDRGAPLFLVALLLVAITLATRLSWFKLMDQLGAMTLYCWQWLAKRFAKRSETSLMHDQKRQEKQQRKTFKEEKKRSQKARDERQETRKAYAREASQREPLVVEAKQPAAEKSPRATREAQMPLFQGASSEGELPPLSLLDEPKEQVSGYSEETLEILSRQVEMKLKDFRIDVTVVGAYPGPVITRFEMEPAPGVRGSQIANLAKDIARGLSVMSVRVVDVIPGKSVIGLEIPNTNRETVFLSEILRSKVYDKASSALTLALGKDIGGAPVVTNLAKMPHLLVAGTTGSGKSVAVNAMILSLLYKANAEQVRIIMIDPKMLELSVYEGIPHLLAPVVTDMKEAANALRWCVGEMERRYKLLAGIGVRNLAGYNKKIRDAKARGEPIMDPLFKPDPNDPSKAPEPLQTLPAIVIVIDEFADMMMIVGKKVEELIARLAQKARAAGIHLILATQRPSVDVITGLIKANIPTRMAFQVSSRIDSRTILDQSGAENLLGYGDMLFLPPGTGMPERVHGAFVDDHEVHAVVEWLKTQGEPDYVEGILEEEQTLADGRIIDEAGIPKDAGGDSNSDAAMYDRAIAVVTKTRRASISGVQRHLRIGYNRAARLVEQMEADGVVSAPQHNGTREVLAPPPPTD